jgi:hypothetical protein
VANYIPPPETLPAFPDAVKVKPKTPVGGGSKLRRRWKNATRILEWDYQHGTVEMYDLRGSHLGEFDPNTGVRLKAADPARPSVTP